MLLLNDHVLNSTAVQFLKSGSKVVASSQQRRVEVVRD
jgi:hypothetical protein